MYRFIGNNTTKRSAIHSTKRSYTSALTNPEQEPAQMEFMRLSYPSTKEGIWNTEEAVSDLKKYGAQLQTERMVAAATQGSLSCRAALSLIIVKSIYMLKDTEKLGLYLQLIREATQTLIDVYRVPRNPEFSEMLHLCLFAFDSVSLSFSVNRLRTGLRLLQGLALGGSLGPAYPWPHRLVPWAAELHRPRRH